MRHTLAVGAVALLALSFVASAAAAAAAVANTNNDDDNDSDNPADAAPGTALFFARPGERVDEVEALFKELTVEGAPCDLPVVEGKLGMREFRLKYWNRSPVVVRGGAKDWPAMRKWTKEYLLERFGMIQTQIGTSNGIIRNGGEGNEYVLFQDYLNEAWKTAEERAHEAAAAAEQARAKAREKALEEEFEREHGVPDIDADDEAAVLEDDPEHGVPDIDAEEADEAGGGGRGHGNGQDRGDGNDEGKGAVFDAINGSDRRYGEQKYLFDRENFMSQARKRGIFSDIRYPPFFRASELSSLSYKSQSPVVQLKKSLGMEDQQQGQQGPGGASTQQPSTTYMFLTPLDRLVGVGMHQVSSKKESKRRPQTANHRGHGDDGQTLS